MVPASPRGAIFSVFTNPERARQLVEVTVGLFVSAGSEGKKRDSVDAGHFIIDERPELVRARLIALAAETKAPSD